VSAVFCKASKAATSKPTGSLSLPDTSSNAGPDDDIDHLLERPVVRALLLHASSSHADDVAPLG
jgi:hypothetical protein